MPRVGETAEERLQKDVAGRENRRRAVSHVSTGLACLPRDTGGMRNYRRRAVVERCCWKVRHSLWPAEIKKAATFQRLLCDPGEARTLDPMIKSHLLYQLSYGVNVLLISVAKVMPFFYPTKFSGYFFQKKLS